MIDPDLAHKALAHPFRREVLRWLKSPDAFPASARLHSCHGTPLSAIVARSGLSQSTVSAHVALLREAGLVIATPVGQWIFVARDEIGDRRFHRRNGSRILRILCSVGNASRGFSRPPITILNMKNTIGEIPDPGFSPRRFSSPLFVDIL